MKDTRQSRLCIILCIYFFSAISAEEEEYATCSRELRKPEDYVGREPNGRSFDFSSYYGDWYITKFYPSFVVEEYKCYKVKYEPSESANVKCQSFIFTNETEIVESYIKPDREGKGRYCKEFRLITPKISSNLPYRVVDAVPDKYILVSGCADPTEEDEGITWIFILTKTGKISSEDFEHCQKLARFCTDEEVEFVDVNQSKCPRRKHKTRH